MQGTSVVEHVFARHAGPEQSSGSVQEQLNTILTYTKYIEAYTQSLEARIVVLDTYTKGIEAYATTLKARIVALEAK